MVPSAPESTHRARLLVAAAEEGVGRRADADALGLRRIHQRLAFGEGHPERLFAVDVLAGGDRAFADLDMGAGDREVEDDPDLGIGEQRVDRHGRDAELGGLRARRPRASCRRCRRSRAPGKSRIALRYCDRNIARADDADADPAVGGHVVLDCPGAWYGAARRAASLRQERRERQSL